MGRVSTLITRRIHGVDFQFDTAGRQGDGRLTRPSTRSARCDIATNLLPDRAILVPDVDFRIGF
jgi:hypothetical protein